MGFLDRRWTPCRLRSHRGRLRRRPVEARRGRHAAAADPARPLHLHGRGLCVLHVHGELHVGVLLPHVLPGRAGRVAHPERRAHAAAGRRRDPGRRALGRPGLEDGPLRALHGGRAGARRDRQRLLHAPRRRRRRRAAGGPDGGDGLRLRHGHAAAVHGRAGRARRGRHLRRQRRHHALHAARRRHLPGLRREHLLQRPPAHHPHVHRGHRAAGDRARRRLGFVQT